MVGKRSYQRKDKSGNYRQYRNYWCCAAQRGRARCEVYNGHSASKLERAILEHLAQYDDPERVRELLAESGNRDTSTAHEELWRVERRLAELERDFLSNLELLKRGVLDEQDFLRANASRKQERTALEHRRAELAAEAKDVQTRTAMASTLPARVRGFLDDVNHLEVRKSKALLQGILSAAHVYRDGRIELEFRSL